MARHLEETDIPIEYKGMNYKIHPSILRSKYGGPVKKSTDNNQTSQVINWMKNWLSSRKDILEKNAEATTWNYSKYYPRRNDEDVRKSGWQRYDYINSWNPLSYMNGYTPTENRLNKLIYSQVENAINTPKTIIGEGTSSRHSLKGVYVEPNSWNNSGNYIAYAGQPTSDVEIHELTHSSHPIQQERYIESVIYKGRDIPHVTSSAKTNKDKAKELYAGLQEFRYNNKLKPSTKITKDWINKNKELFKGTYLENISDDDKIRLFNEVAQNNEIKLNKTIV